MASVREEKQAVAKPNHFFAMRKASATLTIPATTKGKRIAASDKPKTFVQTKRNNCTNAGCVSVSRTPFAINSENES